MPGVYHLRHTCRFFVSHIKNPIGAQKSIVDEKEFMEKLPKVAELAVGDACTGSNPRTITPAQMEELLKSCYLDEETIGL